MQMNLVCVDHHAFAVSSADTKGIVHPENGVISGGSDIKNAGLGIVDRPGRRYFEGRWIRVMNITGSDHRTAFYGIVPAGEYQLNPRDRPCDRVRNKHPHGAALVVN